MHTNLKNTTKKQATTTTRIITTSVWSEREAILLLIRTDNESQQRRAQEGHGIIHHPTIWCRFHHALQANSAAAPTILEHENIVLDHIINLTSFGFGIDRAWASTKNELVTIRSNEYFLTYVTLCPTTPSIDNPNEPALADKELE